MCPRTEKEKNPLTNVPFLEGDGSLMHLANLTRPDISYAVGQISRFSQNPGMKHWKGLKRILAYLRKTINYGLLFGGGNNKLVVTRIMPEIWRIGGQHLEQYLSSIMVPSPGTAVAKPVLPYPLQNQNFSQPLMEQGGNMAKASVH